MNKDEIISELLDLINIKDEAIDRQGRIIKRLTTENVRLCNIVKEHSNYTN